MPDFSKGAAYIDGKIVPISEAKSKLFEYIEIFYNRKRRHSYLGLVSPMEFEYKYNQKTYENAAWTLCLQKPRKINNSRIANR